ncbi:hypothetical protein JTE90_004316 [Oedothorax gibbosus]|uniref:Apple domain-containing protein n=1 Tax=Oedothorax gibbosus TaxID=931172 RepID=A0AAV6VK87_9ARAC|nr:hypothetical protein JTE90_004316 [Oedothorax gibbosus]
MKNWLLILLVVVFPSMYFGENKIPVSQVFYNFSLQDKLHTDWILEEQDHLITCLQQCRNDGNCQGLAVNSVTDEAENYTRTCYTLKNIDFSKCKDGACDSEGTMVYQLP